MRCTGLVHFTPSLPPHGPTPPLPPHTHAHAHAHAHTLRASCRGWSEVGCIAGEVDARVFPAGMGIAAAMVTLAYAVPIVFGVALQPDITQWTDGYFSSLAASVAPWLGVLITVSAMLANMSTLLTSMAAYTRTLQAAARMGAVPLPLLQRSMSQWRTPLPAIALYTATTAVLMYNLNFTSLVVYDSAFYLVGQLSVVLAFYALKRAQPDLPRPFVFPGRGAGAAAATLSSIALAGTSLWFTFSGEAVAGLVVGGVCAGLLGATFAVGLLPCGATEAIAAWYEAIRESGAAHDAEDERLAREEEAEEDRKARQGLEEALLQEEMASLEESSCEPFDVPYSGDTSYSFSSSSSSVAAVERRGTLQSFTGSAADARSDSFSNVARASRTNSLLWEGARIQGGKARTLSKSLGQEAPRSLSSRGGEEEGGEQSAGFTR